MEMLTWASPLGGAVSLTASPSISLYCDLPSSKVRGWVRPRIPKKDPIENQSHKIR